MTHLCRLKIRKVKDCFEKKSQGHLAYGEWQPTALIARDSVHSAQPYKHSEPGAANIQWTLATAYDCVRPWLHPHSVDFANVQDTRVVGS